MGKLFGHEPISQIKELEIDACPNLQIKSVLQYSNL